MKTEDGAVNRLEFLAEARRPVRKEMVEDLCSFRTEDDVLPEEGGLRIRGFAGSRRPGEGWRRVSGPDGGALMPGNPREPDSLKKGELPLITVVTVVYNGEHVLEKTIRSVIGQTYPHIEYLIIDGGSTDATLEIIKKYEGAIDYWVSARDQGIYDAMNKGVRLARGEWINFLNAGDQYFNSETIAAIFLHPDAGDIIYGATLFNYDSRHRKIREPAKPLKFTHGLPFCHQSCFIRTSLHKKYEFSEKYKIHADFDLFAGWWRSGRKFSLRETTIASVDCNGVSSVKGFRRLQELWAIAGKYNSRMEVVKFAIDFAVREFLKIVLPTRITRKIQVSK
jgi:glycosyltransferase involved in cell wall biosynthesis